MAQIVYSPNAISSLERLHDFLVEKNPDAARRAITTILEKFSVLGEFPRFGPVDPERPDMRQLFMPFGAAGYVARYRIVDDAVVILAIRHMREAGYGDDLPSAEQPPPRRR